MLGDPRFEGYNSYIMKAYVDSLEASGARIIPLIVGEPESVTMDKLSKINGILYPGGDGDYLEFGRNLFWKIKEINDNGTYFPIWSTCMGYEYIVSYISDLGWNILDHYEYHSGGMALEFTVDPRKTKMYSWLG
jgi:gamma-glutamyl hydrolase